MHRITQSGKGTVESQDSRTQGQSGLQPECVVSYLEWIHKVLNVVETAGLISLFPDPLLSVLRASSTESEGEMEGREKQQ